MNKTFKLSILWPLELCVFVARDQGSWAFPMEPAGAVKTHQSIGQTNGIL